MSVKANLGELSARVSLDSTAFNKGMAALKREARTAKADFELAGKGVDGFGNKIDKNAGQMKILEREMELSRMEVAKYGEQYRKVSDEVRASGADTSKAMQDLERKSSVASLALVRQAEEYKRLHIEQQRQDSTMYQLGDAMEKTGNKISTTSDKVGKFADKWSKVGFVIGGATGLIVKQFVDWESSVASMEKTIDNSEGQVDRLASSFREMSLEIPVAAKELNEIAGIAGQLGIQGDAIEGFTRVMADLGVTTDLSAEEAAIALAQFANITQMAQGDFERLGSSIVELGNNYATQEGDIVNMAQRLAAAGHQIGLSEADILGVSTALSALGIKAEAGGSAFSKLMINMNVAAATGLDGMVKLEEATGLTRRELELMASNDGTSFKKMAKSIGMTTKEMEKVMKASKNLENFAEVAGMTAEEFKQAFEEDAVNALGAFISGLGEAEESGSSAIEILDEMGITEIRLRDTLLRASGAQDLMNNAVKDGNRAWDENIALTDEANVRYETNASKIQMAKNKIQDMAIELGGSLMPALADLVESSKPIVDMLTDWIQKFADSSDETKKFAVEMLAFTVLGGPALKAITTITGGMGTLLSSTGKGIKAFKDYTFEIKAAAGVSSVLGSSTATTTSMMLSMAPAIGGVVLAVGAGYAAWKLWGEGALEAHKANEKWGEGVDIETARALDTFQDYSSEVSTGNLQMAYDIESGATRASNAYAGMAETMKQELGSAIKESEEGLVNLPESVRKIVAESVNKSTAEQKRLIGELDEIQAGITNVYARAMEENRELTDQELSVIEGYHARMAEIRTETLELSAEEQRKVHIIMAEDLKDFSSKQLSERGVMLREEQKMIRESSEESRAFLQEQYTAGVLDKEQYNQALQELAEEERQIQLELAAEHKKIWDARGKVSEEQQAEELARMGFTLEEVKAYMAETGQVIEETSDVIVKANQMWNQLTFDPHTGTFNTNAKEIVDATKEDEQKWNDLIFMLKYAEMDSNVKQKIKEALIENGTWNNLTFLEKQAIMETNAKQTAFEFMQASGQWDDMTPEQKNLFLDSNTPEQIQQALKDIGVWDSLDPMTKDFIVESNAPRQAQEGADAVGKWNRLHPTEQRLETTTNAPEVANAANVAIQSVTGKTVRINVERYESTYRNTMDAANTGAYATWATGTDFHPGGLAILGDGGNQEPYLTPDGDFGISPNKDTMFDLPRGTKVWRNIEALMAEVPKYAKGTRNEGIKLGDHTFDKLTDALVPFSGMNKQAIAPQTNNTREGDVYNIHLNTYGDLPTEMVRKLSVDISKNLKRENDKRNMARGERVMY